MTFYQPDRRNEAGRVDPVLKSLIVHAFLKEVQVYVEEMIEGKQKALSKKAGDGPQDARIEITQKLRQWRDYHRFNQIALQEIEAGTLDPWFERLLK